MKNPKVNRMKKLLLLILLILTIMNEVTLKGTCLNIYITSS